MAYKWGLKKAVANWDDPPSRQGGWHACGGLWWGSVAWILTEGLAVLARAAIVLSLVPWRGWDSRNDTLAQCEKFPPNKKGAEKLVAATFVAIVFPCTFRIVFLMIFCMISAKKIYVSSTNTLGKRKTDRPIPKLSEIIPNHPGSLPPQGVKKRVPHGISASQGDSLSIGIP